MVLFTFDDKNEMEKILAVEPWSFDKRLMVLQRYGKETDVGEMEFSKVTFWVKVHDLPIRFRTRRIAEKLCEVIGTVTVVTDEAETKGENFMRVRVTLDISQPLCRGRVIMLDSGKEMWVSFKYERLPSLCYWCGCVTHDDRDCDLWIASEGSLSIESQQFDPWIKVAPFAPNRRYMVKVPSFDASKKLGTLMPNYGIAKKPPVVVVRTGKPSPEIIRTKKEHLEAPNSENIAPNFQEVNPLNPNPPTNEGILEDVTLHQAESVEKKVSDVVFEDVISQQPESIEKKMSAEVFEEEIGEIDKEIKKEK